MKNLRSADWSPVLALIGALTLAAPAGAYYVADASHPIERSKWTMIEGPGSMPTDLEFHMQLGWVAKPEYPKLLTSGGLRAPLELPPSTIKNAESIVPIPFSAPLAVSAPTAAPKTDRVKGLFAGRQIAAAVNSEKAVEVFGGANAKVVGLPSLHPGQTVFTTPEENSLPALQVKVREVRGNYTSVSRYDASGSVDRTHPAETLHTASLASPHIEWGYGLQKGDHVVDQETGRQGVVMAFYANGSVVVLDKNNLRHYRVAAQKLKREPR